MLKNDETVKINNRQIEEFSNIKIIEDFRQEFLKNKNVQNSIKILDKLVSIQIDVSKIDNRFFLTVKN